MRIISQLKRKKTSERDIRNSRQILYLLLVIVTHQYCSACWSSNAIWKHLQIVDILDHLALHHESATQRRTFVLALPSAIYCLYKDYMLKPALEQNCEISYSSPSAPDDAVCSAIFLTVVFHSDDLDVS